MSRHVPLCGTLMMVVGILGVVVYLAVAVLYIFMPKLLKDLPGAQGFPGAERPVGPTPGPTPGPGPVPAPPGMPNEEAMKFGMYVGSAMMAFYALIHGVYALAGNFVRTWRNRTFGIVMGIVGCIPCLFAHPCCTYILSLGTGIFTLIVLFNEETAAAFRAGGPPTLPVA